MNEYWELVKEINNSDELDSQEINKKISKLNLEQILNRFEEDEIIKEFYKTIEIALNLKQEVIAFTPKEWIIFYLMDKSVDIDFLIGLNKNKLIKDLLDEKAPHKLKHIDMLESAVKNVYECGYYETELRRLAVIWFRLIKNHAFTNGNKRTAMVGVKISFLSSMVMGYDNKANLHINELIDDFFKKEAKKVKKYISVNIGKPAKERKINRTVASAKRILQKKYKDEISKPYSEYITKEIISKWRAFFPEDYILSVYIASLKGTEISDDVREKIYEIIEMNLVVFALHNMNFLNEEYDKVISKSMDFLNDQSKFGIISANKFTELYKKTK